MDRVDRRGRSAAAALIGAQALTATVAGSIAWIAGGPAAAMAALFGGIAVLLPTVYFAAKVYLRTDGANAGQVLGAFYRAEAGKLVLTAVMFGIGAKLFGQHFAPLILTSVTCIAMNWLIVALTREW